MTNHRIVRLIACATAAVALFAIQASAASATVYTLVSPGTTHTAFGSSNFTFDTMAGYSAYSNVGCNLSGGRFVGVTTGIDAPAWWDATMAPAVSCPPASGVTWTAGVWDVGVQGSPTGNHTGIVKIQPDELRVYINGCGSLRVNQTVTLNGQWIDGAGSTDAKIRFNQDTNVPVQYTGTCPGLGASGPQNLVIDAGSEWKIHNVSPFGAFSVIVYVS